MIKKYLQNKRALSIGIVFALALPTLLHAQGAAQTQATGAFGSLAAVVDNFTNTVVAALGSLFVAAGTVAFFYGMVQYIWGVRQGDAGKAKVGNSFMVWGLVGVFVMVSVWGIVYWFQSIFGIQNQNNIVIPRIQIGGAPQANRGATPAQPLGSPGATAPSNAGATPTSCAGLQPGSACRLRDGSTGFCTASGCMSSPPTGSAANDPNAICRTWGPGTGCTLNGQRAVCTANNICAFEDQLMGP